MFRYAAEVTVLLHFFTSVTGRPMGEVVVLAGAADPTSFWELKANVLFLRVEGLRVMVEIGLLLLILTLLLGGRKN